jgi:hypothetical protein
LKSARSLCDHRLILERSNRNRAQELAETLRNSQEIGLAARRRPSPSDHTYWPGLRLGLAITEVRGQDDLRKEDHDVGIGASSK